MSNNNITCKTSFLTTTIFLTVVTISLIIAPSLYNNSFMFWNTSIQTSINLSYAQLNDDSNSSESSSMTTTEQQNQQQQDEQTTTVEIEEEE